MVKRDLSLKTKLSIYWLIDVSAHTYSHELWYRDRIVRISFLHREGELTLRDRVRSSDIQEDDIRIERSQLRWIRWMPPDPRSRPRPVLCIPSGLKTSWDPLGVAGILAPCLACFHCDLDSDKDWSTHFIHATVFYFYILTIHFFKTWHQEPKLN